jgi:hypothetical protein
VLRKAYQNNSSNNSNEPEEHKIAKYKVMILAFMKGYEVYPEWETEFCCYYRGRNDQSFPVDSYLVKGNDKIFVQIDGPIHDKSKIQKDKTQNRNDSLEDYCLKNGIRYVVLDRDDVLHEFSNQQIYEKLGISN